MKQNNFSAMIGGITLAAMFFILFVVGFTILHQVVNFLLSNPGTVRLYT